MSRASYEPNYYLYEYRRDLAGDLALAAASVGAATVLVALAGSPKPETIGLLAVIFMPFLTYASIGVHALRGTLRPQRWRSARAKREHQYEELVHYALRVLIAACAGRLLASGLGALSGVAAALLPALLYTAQEKPYHDMHVLMHMRGHALPPERSTLASRIRPPRP